MGNNFDFECPFCGIENRKEHLYYIGCFWPHCPAHRAVYPSDLDIQEFEMSIMQDIERWKNGKATRGDDVLSDADCFARMHSELASGKFTLCLMHIEIFCKNKGLSLQKPQISKIVPQMTFKEFDSYGDFLSYIHSCISDAYGSLHNSTSFSCEAALHRAYEYLKRGY